MRRGFFSGLAVYMGAGFEVIGNGRLRVWYGATVVKAFAFSALILGLLIGAGAYAVRHGVSSDLVASLALIAWILIFLFVSGTLTAALMNVFIGAVVNQKALVSALSSEKVVALKKALWRDRRREAFASLRCVILSLLVGPLMVFLPPLAPFGVAVIAWSIGDEALRMGLRLRHQNAEKAASDEGLTGIPYSLGVGLLPALAAFVPIVGWACLPVLVVAGYKGQRLFEAQAR